MRSMTDVMGSATVAAKLFLATTSAPDRDNYAGVRRLSARCAGATAALAALCLVFGASAPVRAQGGGSACLGQLMAMGGNYCPVGYIDANGQLLSIGQNSALYSLYGTMYGGNGTTTFGVPDLRGRAPISQGQGPGLPSYTQGELTGSATTTITQPNLPAYSPQVRAISGAPSSPVPSGRLLATAQTSLYGTAGTIADMAPNMIAPLGSNQPMTTQSPIQAIRWCVAVQGIYCSRP